MVLESQLPQVHGVVGEVTFQNLLINTLCHIKLTGTQHVNLRIVGELERVGLKVSVT